MCSSGCPTPGAHKTFGECLRSKDLQLSNLQAKAYHKYNDGEIDAYADARRQGIQPETTKAADVTSAVMLSEATGVAYRADTF